MKHQTHIEEVKTSGWGVTSGRGYRVECSCGSAFPIRNLRKTAEADEQKHKEGK